MLINIDLSQGTDINPEFILVIQHFRQFGIQAVNAFDHKDIVFSQFLGILS